MKRFNTLFVGQFIALLVVVALLASCGKNSKKSKSNQKLPKEQLVSSELPEVKAIELGFNAKGNLNAGQQTAMFETLLQTLPEHLRKRLHVRISGGTLSQRQLPNDWHRGDRMLWIALQKQYHFGLVYVINGNDTPESQRAFLGQWIDEGARFSFLEMMNEYYLSKFKAGDTSKPGVTRKVDFIDYTSDILPRYVDALADLDIPMHLIFAPMKGRKVDDYNAQWNEHVAQFVHQGYKNATFGAAVHLYFDGGAYDYDQITALRALLPEGTSIAVSESGLVAKTKFSPNEVGELTVQHYAQIGSRLLTCDYLFDHVLYNDYKNDLNATLHPNYKGLSPKGEFVMAWMKTVYPD